MIKRLLLAVDGTKSGLTARGFAIAWAGATNSALTGVSVLDAGAIAGPEAVPLGGSAYKDRRDAHHLEQARRYLMDVQAGFLADAAGKGITANGLLLEGPADAILKSEADSHDAIVIGHKTSFDLGDERHGMAVIERLLADNPRPIVVTPDVLGGGDTILIAYDGSVPAMRALQLFALLGDVWRPRSAYVVTVDQNGETAGRLAQRATDFLLSHGYHAVPFPVVSDRDAFAVIAETATAKSAAMIVQGAYGHRSWLDFVLGSTTTELLADPPCLLFLSH